MRMLMIIRIIARNSHNTVFMVSELVNTSINSVNCVWDLIEIYEDLNP